MRFYDTVPYEPESKASERRYVVVKSVHLPIIACLHKTLPAGEECVLPYYRRSMTQQVGVKAWKR